MKHLASMLFVTVAGMGIAAAETRVIIPGEAETVVEDSDPVMAPIRPVNAMKLIGRSLGPSVSNVVNSHIIYMNQCAGGCSVSVGDNDSRTDHSTAANRNGVLSAFNGGASEWSTIMSCMTSTMSRFNVTVTDVDPGQAPHFEVMVAGTASQLGLSSSYGGIAPVPCGDIGMCDPYLPNALVFAFANASFYQGAPLDICATAAQEVAHAWILDHVVSSTDPMTYNPYNGMRQFQDNMRCGSDCVGGQSPFGLPCSGSGGSATHACMVDGAAIQNDVQMITALFGPAGAIAPSLQITAPANGATVPKGFEIDINCDSGDGVTAVDITIDGTAVSSLHTAPYKFTTGANLAAGSHRIDVQCTTTAQAASNASATVTIGAGCTTATDCSNATDICFNGVCVAGMGAKGGLGASCGGPTECQSTMCAGDDTGMYCVIPCDLNIDGQCPAGFTCTPAGASGVCFPGGDSGGGCLSASGDHGVLMLLIGGAVVVITRRRKRA